MVVIGIISHLGIETRGKMKENTRSNTNTTQIQYKVQGTIQNPTEQFYVYELCPKLLLSCLWEGWLSNLILFVQSVSDRASKLSSSVFRQSFNPLFKTNTSLPVVFVINLKIDPQSFSFQKFYIIARHLLTLFDTTSCLNNILHTRRKTILGCFIIRTVYVIRHTSTLSIGVCFLNFVLQQTASCCFLFVVGLIYLLCFISCLYNCSDYYFCSYCWIILCYCHWFYCCYFF